MKGIIRAGLIIAVSVLAVSGCKGKDKADENASAQDTDGKAAEVTEIAETGNEDTQENETDGAEQGGTDGICTLFTDDKSVSITITRPEGYESPEYSSELQVAFQRMGADGQSSTQLNFRLVAGSEDEVMTVAQQEVGYILSANADASAEEAVTGEVQTSMAGERQWSYFTYSTEGLEGVRAWVSLSNGCVLSCMAENLGSGLEPLNAESLLQTLDAAIQE